jgi:hypothetical protein
VKLNPCAGSRLSATSREIAELELAWAFRSRGNDALRRVSDQFISGQLSSAPDHNAIRHSYRSATIGSTRVARRAGT